MAQFGGSQSSEFVWKYLCVYCVSELKKKKKRDCEWVSCTFSLCKLAVDPTSSFHGFFHFFLSIFCLSFFFAYFSNIQMDLANLSIRCIQIGRSELDGNGFGLKLCFTAKIIGIAEQETMAVWIDVVGYMAMPLWALRHQVWYGFLAVGVPMGCGFGMRLLNMLWKPWKNQPWKLSQLPLLLQSFESSHDVLL